MEDPDIKKLRKILRFKKREDLSNLLKGSRSDLLESSTFGNRYYSFLSTFEIFSPVRLNEKLISLTEKDKCDIYDALLLIYPTKDGAPEIVKINYYPDFELEDDADLVDTESLNNIDFEYIQNQIKKCNQKIIEKDFEGSITNSRTLLESICLYIYEKKKGDYDYKGNLVKLYKEVSALLNMNPAEYPDGNLKQILSGAFSIINGVAGLRNDFSDAHGSSPSKKYKIDERHAILTVNLSKVITEYLFLSYEKSEKNNII